MKKRLAALLLAMLLVLALLPGAFAAPELILVCTDGVFQQSVNEDNMPVFIDGALYIPYSFLSGVKAVNCVYNSSLRQLLVYNLDYRMTFDLAGDQTYDSAGELFAGKAVWRGGTVFVPIKLICLKFGLYFSYIEKSSANIIAPVARIASESPSVDDMPFVVRNISTMKAIADAYAAAATPSGDDLPPETDTPPVRPPEPQPDTLVYFIFQGEVNEYTAEILDVLARRRISAAFFVDTLSALDEDVLRRIYAEGHTVGLYADLEGLSEEETAQTLLRAEEALSSVLHTKTRLQSVSGGSETLSAAQVELIIDMGFRLWDGNVYDTSGGSSAASSAASINRRLSASGLTKVAAFASEEDTAAVLERVAAYVAAGGFSLLTANEWDAPVNSIREVR